jgi:protein gp37
MRIAGRLEAMGQPKYIGTTRKSGGKFVWSGHISLDGNALRTPLSWKKPKRIFVNSMSDLFHEAVPESFIQHVWKVMERASWHTYQVLTKRPDKMASTLSGSWFPILPNVWLGTSIENQQYLFRLDHLRNTPAAVRFASLEPLLGPLLNLDLTGIDWVIVGGESGPGARPMETSWVNDIQRQCAEQSVPFFFKQWGGTRKKCAGRTFKGRTWDEYPALIHSFC